MRCVGNVRLLWELEECELRKQEKRNDFNTVSFLCGWKWKKKSVYTLYSVSELTHANQQQLDAWGYLVFNILSHKNSPLLLTSTPLPTLSSDRLQSCCSRVSHCQRELLPPLVEMLFSHLHQRNNTSGLWFVQQKEERACNHSRYSTEQEWFDRLVSAGWSEVQRSQVEQFRLRPGRWFQFLPGGTKQCLHRQYSLLCAGDSALCLSGRMPIWVPNFLDQNIS